MKLETERLTLVGATSELLELDSTDRTALWKELGSRAPKSWPAPLNDDNSLLFSLSYAKKNRGSPWGSYYFLLKEPFGAIVVGNGGFKGAPDSDGIVELGYSIIPEYHGRGLATEATEALTAFALSQPDVKIIRGETLPDLKASIRVLEKNGFTFVGEGSEPGVIRYERVLPGTTN